MPDLVCRFMVYDSLGAQVMDFGGVLTMQTLVEFAGGRALVIEGSDSLVVGGIMPTGALL